MADATLDGLPSDVAKPGDAAPAPGTPEHAALQVKKFEDSQEAARKAASPSPEVPAKPERPADVPEKFWDAEKGEVRTAELLKSYSELESGKTKTPVADQPGTGEVKPADEAAADPANQAEMDGYSKELADNGKLSDESYKKLEAKGYAKATVDSYIEGQQALAEVRKAEAFTEAGGEEAYLAMAKWATTGMDQAAREAFNAGIRGSRAEAKAAVQSLKAAHLKAFGQEPTLMGGRQGVIPGSGGYESMAQATVDMKDPRYKTDSAFRAKVSAKLEASSF